MTLTRFTVCAAICTMLLCTFLAATFVFCKREQTIVIQEKIAQTVYEEPVTISSSVRIVFVGDVLLARAVERLMNLEGYEYPFHRLEKLFDANAVIANFESAIPAVHVPTPDFNTTFSVATSTLPILSSSGITHVSLANNHSNDFGVSALQHTYESLTDSGLVPFGLPNAFATSSLTLIPYADKTVALIGIHAVFGIDDMKALDMLLSRASEMSDHQIAYVHWGEEYVLKHNKTQERLAEHLIDRGIDLVIGHHPHVVQDVGIYKDRVIVYSLGNFVFDQYFSTDVQEGLALSLEQVSGEYTLVLIPVTSIDKRASPRQMNEEEKVVFLQKLAERSAEEVKDRVSMGTINLDSDLQFHHSSATMSSLRD